MKGLREVELNLIMTEVCGAISRIMMEVGGATSSVELLKVIRGIISGNFYLCGNRYEIVYFIMRQKFLHRIEESYDDGGMW